MAPTVNGVPLRLIEEREQNYESSFEESGGAGPRRVRSFLGQLCCDTAQSMFRNGIGKVAGGSQASFNTTGGMASMIAGWAIASSCNKFYDLSCVVSLRC
jgi:hypothetical protein